jgi:hypothetical protein
MTDQPVLPVSGATLRPALRGARPLLLTLCLGLAASCGVLEDRQNRAVTFEGIRFNADVRGSGEEGRDMVITVRPASVNVGAALEAGRYEAVKYCLRNFGGSDAEWQIGPDTPPEQITVTDDTITLVGRCTQPA